MEFQITQPAGGRALSESGLRIVPPLADQLLADHFLSPRRVEGEFANVNHVGEDEKRHENARENARGTGIGKVSVDSLWNRPDVGKGQRGRQAARHTPEVSARMRVMSFFQRVLIARIS